MNDESKKPKIATDDEIRQAMPGALKDWVDAGPSAAEFIGHIKRRLERDGLLAPYKAVFSVMMSEEAQH